MDDAIIDEELDVLLTLGITHDGQLPLDHPLEVPWRDGVDAVQLGAHPILVDARVAGNEPTWQAIPPVSWYSLLPTFNMPSDI